MSLTLGNIRLWDLNSVFLSSSRTRCIPFGLTLILIGFISKQKNDSTKLSLEAICLSIWGVFFSDWLLRGFNYFQAPTSRYYILSLAFIATTLLSLTKTKLIKYSLPLLSSIFIITFFIESKGRPIFIDDHSVFFYRLQLLKENFPFIPFFNPLWNGGIDQRDFFASGCLNFFTIFSPIIYLFDLANSYNFMIAGLLFLITPYSTYLSSRIFGFCRITSTMAGILTMCTGLVWYRWALKYGTVGFITSLSLLPLIISLATYVLRKESNLTKFKVFAIGGITTLFLMWPLAGLTIIPTLLISLSSFKTIIKKKGVISLLILLLILNIPWMTAFWSVSKISHFVKAEKPSEQSQQHTEQQPQQVFKNETNNYSAKSIIKPFSETSISCNPLILFLGIFGIFFVKDKRLRLIFVCETLWLLILGTFGVTYKPQLELDRMNLVLFLVLCIPTSLLCNKLINEFIITGNLSKKVLASLPIGFLFYGPFATFDVLNNKTVEHFSFQSNEYLVLKNEIEKIHATDILNNNSGRILFTGCVIHELTNQHLAPLATDTKAPLIASSFVHNLWNYKQIFPDEFLTTGDTGIKSYLDLYNVSHVIAHEDKWREYFYTRPNEYSFITKIGKFSIYKRLNFVSNYFLSGNGENVEQTENLFAFKAKTSEIVLKLNFFDFLEVKGCQKIEPVRFTKSVTFTKLTGCDLNENTNDRVEIKMENIIKRVLK